MKKTLLLAIASLVALSCTNSAIAADNKATAGAKKVGQAVMWGPKKVWQGLGWTGKKVSNGFKKVTGK